MSRGNASPASALGPDDYLANRSTSPNWSSASGRSRAASPPPTAARSGPAAIQLDPVTRIVAREGRRLPLSGKELAVLDALLTASPGAVSAERLLEQAWDENADPFTKTVRMTISRLRRKLGDPNVIETIPAVGYRVAAAA